MSERISRRSVLGLTSAVALASITRTAFARDRLTLRFGASGRLGDVRLTLGEISSWDHYDDGSFDAQAELTAARRGRTQTVTIGAFAVPRTVTLLGRRVRIVAATREGLVFEL